MIRHPDGTLALETLVAYADAALPPAEMAQVAAALASDGEAARTVAAMQASGPLAARAFDDVLGEPVPERLLAAATGMATGGDASGRPAPRARNDNLRRIAAAIVAGLLLIGGFVGGRLTSDTSSDADLELAGATQGDIANPAALGALHSLLSDAPAAGVRRDFDGGTAKLEAPLALVDGTVCWQFGLESTADTASAGIACPDPSGGWAILSLAVASDVP